MRSVLILFVIVLVSCSGNTESVYYANGKIKTELTIVDGKKNGRANAYYENGEIQLTGNYASDLLEGKVITYFKNGKIESETNYISGVKTGIYKEYYENGEIKAEANLKNNMQDGLTKEFYETGKIKAQKNFKDNIQNGDFVFYYPNSKVKVKAVMENDITVYFQEYDSLGNIGKEYREIKANISLQKIKLKENFTANFKLTGPINEVLIDVFTGECLSGSKITKMSLQKLNDRNELKYSYTPNNQGIYQYRIWFIVRDKDLTNARQYTYESTFVCE